MSYEDEENRIKREHDIEQMSAAMDDIATMTSSYYKKLVTKGLSPDIAAYLTGVWYRVTFGPKINPGADT